MRVSILPKTSLGRWSAGLAIASILLIVLVILRSGQNYGMALAVTLTIVTVGICGAAFATGLTSIMRNRERSILVFLGMLIGLWGAVIWGWSWLI
jgi:hypothetical protein